MLDAHDLTLWRGPTRLFESLSFGVEGGHALVVRGPNGAGKTTLLRVVCGLTRPERGAIAWNGVVSAAALRGRVAYSGHEPALNADLTVRRNLEFYAAFPGASGNWRQLLEALGLARCEDLEVRHLSAGQKRRAGLARVLMSNAPAWLLDEPLTHLDDEGRRFVTERIGAHLERGGLAVVTSHDELVLPPGRSATLVLGEA